LGLALGPAGGHPAGKVRSVSKYIGIDLGTANVLVYVKGRGIVLNEPSVVAYSATDNRVVAVGSHARQMLGRTPGRIIVSRPMRDGVIADYLVTEAMLRYFISKVVGKYSLFRPVVMVCIPAGVTNVESRAVLDATIQAGAKEAHLIAEPLAAIVTNVKGVLEQTPPELAADVADKGMILTGGGALLRNLDRLLARETGVPAYVSDDPLSCVAIGAGWAFEYLAGSDPDGPGWARCGARPPRRPLTPSDHAVAVPEPDATLHSLQM